MVAVEVHVCRALGLRPIASSQIVPRDLHAAFIFSLARTLASVEAIAMQVRLGHQTEVAEIREGFGLGQKGSSAMPHKENPATAEQICGLARLARASIAPMLEDVALWHERDLTHSSVERVVVPDICSVTHYALRMAQQLSSQWIVDEDQIQANLKRSQDLTCSQSLLHALIDAGHSRDDAYRLTQAAALSAKEHGTTLLAQAMLLDLGLSDEALARALDMTALLTNADRAVDELEDCWAARRVM